MEIHSTPIPGCLLLDNPVHSDDRGLFKELYHFKAFEKAQLPLIWAQDNFSLSKRHVLRGLHLQGNHPQGKLVRCLKGDIYDVCADLRPESVTFGQWYGAILSSSLNNALYIPPGCAHGFYVLGEEAGVYYKCTTIFDSASDGGIQYDDKTLRIEWPIPAHVSPILSARDKLLPSFNDYLKQTH